VKCQKGAVLNSVMPEKRSPDLAREGGKLKDLQRSVVSVLASLVLGSVAPAVARSEDAPADTAVVPIGGVTVTGSRHPETPLEVPAAISNVPRERFAATRQISLADALDRVPGVFSQSRGGGQDVRITIRGYGARGNGERSNSGNMRGIRVLTDGVPLTEPDGRTSLEFIDLGGASQVEVLRSNGSALYGNASGGVVHLRTALDFDRGLLELHGRGGSFGFHREQLVAGYLLGTGRGRTSAYISTFEGWREHSESATTSIQNRISAPLGERTRLGVLLDYVSNFNRYPGPLTQAQLDADPEQANSTFVTRDERRFNRVGRLGLLLDAELPAEQSLSFSSWVEPKVLQRSERNRFRDFHRYHVGGTANWRMTSSLGGLGKATWMVGADQQFQDGSILFYDLQPDGSRGTTVIQNKREGANSGGVFAQVELKPTDEWSLRLAGRYDNLRYLSEDRISPTLSATRRFTQVTPKGSIARLFLHHTLYAAVGGGVEAPAFNEIDPPAPFDTVTSFNPFLEPMRSVSYEVGAKGLIAGEGSPIGTLGYDAALYWIDVRNEIIPFNGGAYFFTAGKSRRHGAELGLSWTPSPRLTLAGSVTASENEYIDYVNDLGDFGGNEVAGLPASFADAEARVRVLTGLSVTGRMRHVDDYFADDANTASVKAFQVFGAEAEYVRSLPFGLVRAFVAADNLTDEKYVASAFINGIDGQFYEPGLPSNLSAGLSISWQ
jgi:iron complex outermembrane recepter protein